jgi:hypothetical protein
MGYGSRSLELLQLYYEGQLTTLDEHTDVAGETGTEETGADEVSDTGTEALVLMSDTSSVDAGANGRVNYPGACKVSGI